MAHPAPPLPLRIEDRLLLEDKIRSRRTPERIRQRCQIILMGAEGKANAAIAGQLKVDRSTVQEWRRRFGEGQIGAILEDADGPRDLGPRVRHLAHLLDQAPPDGAPIWTVRALARASGYSLATVQRQLGASGLRISPRRPCDGLDPAWLAGIEDLAGFYLHSPFHALVFEVDPGRLGGAEPLTPVQARPGSPAWNLHLQLRSIEGLRQLDGRSTHYTSNFWGFLAQIRPGRADHLTWCITDAPLSPECIDQLERDKPGLRVRHLESGQRLFELLKSTLVPVLQARLGAGGCPSLAAAVAALEAFLRDGTPDPLQWWVSTTS